MKNKILVLSIILVGSLLVFLNSFLINKKLENDMVSEESIIHYSNVLEREYIVVDVYDNEDKSKIIHQYSYRDKLNEKQEEICNDIESNDYIVGEEECFEDGKVIHKYIKISP